MKHIFAFACFILLSFSSHGQSSNSTAYDPKLPIEKFDSLTDLIRKGIKVGSVKAENGYFDIVYFLKDGTDRSAKRTKVLMKRGSSFVIKSGYNFNNWSLINVPFKVRPRLRGTNEMAEVPLLASASIKNVGVFNGFGRTVDKYLVNGKILTQKALVGAFLAPSVEEYNLKNSNNKLQSGSQLVTSVGLSLTYTRNAITLSLIPFAIDIGLTKQSRDWVHNNKPWFGFGLGIDFKSIGF